MDNSLSKTAFGAGIPLGAGIGSAVAVVLNTGFLGVAVGYGVGAGILVGAALAF